MDGSRLAPNRESRRDKSQSPSSPLWIFSGHPKDFIGVRTYEDLGPVGSAHWMRFDSDKFGFTVEGLALHAAHPS